MQPKERTEAAIARSPTQCCRIAGTCCSLSGHIVGIANTSNSSPARDRLSSSVWRDSGFKIGAGWQRPSRPSGDDAAQSGWMTRQAWMLFCTLAPASEARRVKMIIRTTPRGSARVPVSKGPAPAVHKSGVGGAGPHQHIGLNPPGCRRDRILHPGNVRRSSAIMRASAWRRISGPAWRSIAHQSSTLYVVAMLPLARS